MADTIASERTGTTSLPGSAPKVRLTAGLGTANQKTWNLRRPVTLIGASRLAHIALPEDSVSRAHCIIVNTGRWVLLKDLDSTNGTCCNGEPANLVVLNDGDVLQLGDTTVQVAIQESKAEDPGSTEAGTTYHDPLLLPQPATLNQTDGSNRWSIERTVTVIGRRAGSCIRFDHPDVSLVHTALVYVNRKLAVFDLNSGTGSWVNGKRENLAPLNPGDSLKVGPFELVVEGTGEATPAREPEEPSVYSDQPTEAQVDRLLVMEEALNTRARALEKREQDYEQELAALEAARATLENDRRALEHQARALRKARDLLEGERQSLLNQLTPPAGFTPPE